MRVSRHLFLAAAALAAACGDGGSAGTPRSARFAVVSDPHLYDAATLGAEGTAFDAYVASGGEMLRESGEILDAVLADLATRGLDFVLISGDLTKDGERVDHELMASKLAALEVGGTQVLVVPGNHDTDNRAAMSYSAAGTAPVASVSAEEFRQVYRNHGFADALATDASSLSYVAEPVAGIWVLALDSRRYAQDGTGPVTGGALSEATQRWAVAVLGEARKRGKIVLAMVHHGVVQHFAGQAAQFSDFLLDDYAATGKRLADAGLRVVFTGHFHANDVTRVDFGSSFLYDVETGSTITSPSAYRLVELDGPGQRLLVETPTLKRIPSHPSDFDAFSRDLLATSARALAVTALTSAPLSFDEATAQELASLVATASVAHFAGDERLDDPEQAAAIEGLLSSGSLRLWLAGELLRGAWTDLPPADLTVELSLR